MSPNNPPNPPSSRSAPVLDGPRTVAIVTQGCKLNQADSQGLAQEFAQAGYRMVDPGAGPQVFVLNTCTVTGAADAKARQALRAARRTNPQALVVATGCYAERAPENVESLAAVSLVVGNSRKHELVSLVTSALQERTLGSPWDSMGSRGLAPENNVEVLEQLPVAPSFLGRTRAMIKIQEGCDQVCAYCIVPKVRGRERSIPMADLISRVKECQDQGFQEVVLTGTQLGSYGFDLPEGGLKSLLAAILAETSVPRIRVSSIQPQEFRPGLLGLWQDSRLCPHFHIPLQSGSDEVLQAMRRRYDTNQFAAAVEMVRQDIPDPGITTDVIVGFPGETDEMFQAGLDFAASMEFSDIHVFPFSPRPGTSAFHYKTQVPGTVKKERMARMLSVAAETSGRFRHQQLGRTYPVLWESCVPGNQTGGKQTLWSGLTHNYLRVHGRSAKNLGNAITNAKLVAEDGSLLNAVVLEE